MLEFVLNMMLMLEIVLNMMLTPVCLWFMCAAITLLAFVFKRQNASSYFWQFVGDASVWGALIKEEEMEQGSVSYGVYTFYWRAMNWAVFIGFLMGYLVFSGFSVGTNFWLSTWSGAAISADNVNWIIRVFFFYWKLGVYMRYLPSVIWKKI